MVHRQVGEHLAVELEAFGLYLAHEFGVGHPVLARGGVDALDPQPAERPFFIFPVAIGVREALFDRVFGNRPYVASRPEVALGQLHYLFSPRPRGDGID